MLGPRYSYDGLATWCRAIRHGHGAGLSLARVFQMQARSGPKPLREAADRIASKVEAGDTLEDALAAEADLPELFVALAAVGERSGRIPEVFGQLEEYYRLQAQMRREFRAQATWPPQSARPVSSGHRPPDGGLPGRRRAGARGVGWLSSAPPASTR